MLANHARFPRLARIISIQQVRYYRTDIFQSIVINLLIKIMQREQANSASANVSKTEASRVKSTEWEEARPYNGIPKVGLMNFVGHMLPGGR